MIELTDLCHSYGLDAVLNDLTFSVRPGEIFGLLGPDGAGKSTLIGILIIMIQRSSGSLKIDGIDIDANSKTVRSLIALFSSSRHMKT